MGKRIWFRCFALSVLFAGVLGCGQKLNLDRTYTVGQLELQSLLVDAPKEDQKLTVDVSSPGVPIDVFVVLDANVQAVTELMKSGKTPGADKILAGKEKVEAIELTTTVPGGKAFAVMVG